MDALRTALLAVFFLTGSCLFSLSSSAGQSLASRVVHMKAAQSLDLTICHSLCFFTKCCSLCLLHCCHYQSIVTRLQSAPIPEDRSLVTASETTSLKARMCVTSVGLAILCLDLVRANVDVRTDLAIGILFNPSVFEVRPTTARRIIQLWNEHVLVARLLLGQSLSLSVLGDSPVCLRHLQLVQIPEESAMAWWLGWYSTSVAL